jgi:hypothetical protein
VGELRGGQGAPDDQAMELAVDAFELAAPRFEDVLAGDQRV